MEISPRKPSKRAQEPIDEWLHNEGYFRKLAPRDPTCLFRAVSEHVYLTQHYHIRVRKECVEYIRKMKHLFIENISIPFEDYLAQMACFTEWGGMNEIQAMSLLYKRDFVILNGQKKITRTVTKNGFKNVIYLCHTPQKQYENIYTKEFIAHAAYCQSIVYQILYKNVFHMPNIETIAHKMLHDRTAIFRHDKFFLKGNTEMREQLTTEIYDQVNAENNDVNEIQIATKGIPPFPYRIAKALDPNIYRNTDVDIWHEIRREVKNARWTTHNSHQLQIGDKCLVQINFSEDNFDQTNNNNVYVSSLEKDSNGNDTKVVLKKSTNSIFYYGHIQEMSKNQGPVLVFIEELGEKKVVPYSSLKPLPLKKGKQNNWLPSCKKNLLLDSNQTWKKACSSASRKIKESVNSNILSSKIDKHEDNDNIVNDISKNSAQWKEEHLNVDHQVYENYPMEKCLNYSAGNSIETFPTRMIDDNAQSSSVDNNRQDNNKECNEKNVFLDKNSNNNLIGNLHCESIINNEDNELNLYSKQIMPPEMYYSLYSDSTGSGVQMDHMLRSINWSVQKSIDINGSDLPLSDPFTLRFFYNLGLEYFRGGSNWNYLTNGQSLGFGQWYQGMPPNSEEITNMTNVMMQGCDLKQPKKEYNNDQKENSTQSFCHVSGDKCQSLSLTDMQTHKNESPKREDNKDLLHPFREKVKGQTTQNKDTSRLNRNGLGPRFKKQPDNRHQHVSHYINQYPAHGVHPNASKLEKSTKGDNINIQHLQSVPYQLHNPTGAVNSYQPSYLQQGMYFGLSYHANEAESFTNSYYQSNPGFVSIPYLPHFDVHDGSNMQPFSPHLCPGMDYSQAYNGLYPPHLCPLPAPYNMPLQNMQEPWYAVAGQPHYMQCAPTMPVATTETTCNGATQNANQNASI